MDKKIGFIGLGKMGGAMSAHLVEEGYAVEGFDPDLGARDAAAENGVHAHESYESMVAMLGENRVVWLMVSSKIVGDVLAELLPSLSSGDTVIDGGNSFFKNSIRRHKELAAKGVGFLDCGTSGGVKGARHGASLMIGGKKELFDTHEHIFKILAAPNGYGYMGADGAGHFVKMVHNGIEYGMMGAIAEGINVLQEHREAMSLDIKEALKVYDNKSIIDSSLIAWLRKACTTPGYLDSIKGEVPRGETESEMEYIVNISEVVVLKAAIEQRQKTREHPSYTGALISAMRNQFGGHTVVKKDESA